MIEKPIPFKEQVYSRIKEDILTGKYQSGDILNEHNLATELGISRTPVREALQMLAVNGWIEINAFRKATVRDFDNKVLRETMKIRTALEVLVIEEAFPHIQKEDLEKLKALVDQQEADPAAEIFPQLDQEFHLYLYKLADNGTLFRILSNLQDIFRLYTYRASTMPFRKIAAVQEHRNIIAALQKKDLEKAKAAMQYHIDTTFTSMAAGS